MAKIKIWTRVMENYMGMSLGLEVWDIRALKSWGGGSRVAGKKAPIFIASDWASGCNGVYSLAPHPRRAEELFLLEQGSRFWETVEN